MKKRNILLFFMFGAITMSTLSSCGKGKDEFDEKGRMILNLRNLYFNNWTGGDAYTSYIEDKFNVSINPSSYSWADWDQQVWGPVNADNLSDVFHFNLDSYNFANSYEFWAKGDTTKALPEDMSKWPNIQNMINNTSNIENLYIDGKLYALPIVKDISLNNKTYSPFTYIYRRDWAKELGVYQENDTYTWEQFNTLLNAFYKNKCSSGDFFALADVEWGYPSIINFYKDAPHCFTFDDNNNVVANYSTDKFIKGLDIARNWTIGTNKYYGYDQYAANDGDVSDQFCAGRVGVFFENLSLSNYAKIRKTVKQRGDIKNDEQLNDATAIMKVSGEDGKYALEGTENWFSATFFSSDISDEKQEKILDILDWLLSDEGTMMSLYGIKDYDYTIDENNNITLLEAGWEKDMNGEYIEKLNGAKFLRYMATLGYDTNKDDPLVDQKSFALLDDWYKFMDNQLQNNNLRVLEENSKVKWLSTPVKASKSGTLLDGANTAIVQYSYGKIDKEAYLNTFNSTVWNNVLKEINDKLGK